ncbi:hypothetical protein [Streptomyces winkii]|uniref:hypothetical protein n=1 Tax=Streptomyces winkii TaxID=3051178 RepID=UPI0028D71214|nr:hypothetical protein [Streptomyces sp. DSM 40971]
MAARRHGRRQAWVTGVAAAAAGASLLLATGCTENDAAVASDRDPPASYGDPGASGSPNGSRAGDGSSGAGSGSGSGGPGARRTPGLTAPSDPGKAVRAAADALARHGTSRTRTSMSMASGGTRIAVRGEGRFDYRKGEGGLTVRLPEGTSGARPGERRTVTELVVPGALYMKNRGAGVPRDKWVRVDTDALADGNLISAGATDPESAAELLRGARHVTYEGAVRTPGGTAVRRYRGTLDLAAAARAASPHRRGQLEAAARGFSERSVPFDAQIDGQGRLRKVRHEFTFAGGTPSGRDGTESGRAGGGRDGGDRGGVDGIAVASTTWFYGYGAPVKVVMPEPDDIYAGEIAPF